MDRCPAPELCEVLGGLPMNNDLETRDPWWLKWLKFVVVIVVPAGLLAAAFFLSPYFLDERITRPQVLGSSPMVMRDPAGYMRLRFWLGAAIGGGIGATYVVRCIVRRDDP